MLEEKIVLLDAHLTAYLLQQWQDLNQTEFESSSIIYLFIYEAGVE